MKVYTGVRASIDRYVQYTTRSNGRKEKELEGEEAYVSTALSSRVFCMEVPLRHQERVSPVGLHES